MTLTPSPNQARLAALGWAAFVACSWTWCIGMYLPVLLIRDFGPAGWFVFALPNVVGAAALGWVLHKPGAAASLSRRHWPAAVAFSVVTILFHAFFVGWIIRSMVGDAAELITLLAAIGFHRFGRRGNRDLAAASILLGFSVIAFIVAASLPGPYTNGPAGRFPEQGLLWLAPVCIFGFLLCPYLDLTFLRARASTAPNQGIAAFTLGFGIMFLVMILFTFWYARLMQPFGLRSLPRFLTWVIAGHLMFQTAFTVALHTRAISEDRQLTRPLPAAAFFVAILIAFNLGVWGERFSSHFHSTGETIYRLFMAFYGLIFPAYVWICMVPTCAAVENKQKLAVLCAAVLVAAPMFWLGFIANQWIWLVPGLAIVLLSRIAATRVISISSRSR